MENNPETAGFKRISPLRTLLTVYTALMAVFFFFCPAFFFYYNYGHLIEGSLDERFIAPFEASVARFVAMQKSIFHVTNSWGRLTLSEGVTRSGKVIEIPPRLEEARVGTPAMDLPRTRLRFIWDAEILDAGDSASAVRLSIVSAAGTLAETTWPLEKGRFEIWLDADLKGAVEAKGVTFNLVTSGSIHMRLHGVKCLRERDGLFTDRSR